MNVKSQKFYYCQKCGNLVGKIYDSGVELFCCGNPMTELVANTNEGAAEKHLPVVSCAGNTVTVKVGENPHPMSEEHQISWVYLQTTRGGHRKVLAHNGAPEVAFALTDDEQPVAAFAYCNLHLLWKTDIQ